MPPPVLTARDVRGACRIVPLAADDSVDAARAKLALAFGHDNARAVIGAVARARASESDAIKGSHSWTSSFGDADVDVVVVGFVRVRAKTLGTRPRRGSGTSFARECANDEWNATRSALESHEMSLERECDVDVGDGGGMDIARESARGEASTTGRPTATRSLPRALERLCEMYVALSRASMFLIRQGQQPTMRVAMGMVRASVGLNADVVRAMETMCPSSISLISRLRNIDDDALGDRDELLVDITAPDDPNGSGFDVPAHMRGVRGAESNADAVVAHASRRSARSLGAMSRDSQTITARFGVNFARATDRCVRAFRRGLFDLLERMESEPAEDAPLSDFIRAAERVRDGERRAASVVAVDDRPPAPPRKRAVKSRKLNDENTGAKQGKDADASAVCASLQPMDVDEFVAHLSECLGSRGQIAHVERMQGKPPSRCALPSSVKLSDATVAAFAGVGLDVRGSLFSHQASALEATLGASPTHVVVATGTASGKSVCYNVPIVNALLDDPKATALYIFPTKALAQDQIRALRAIVASVPSDEELTFGVEAYDGDTPEGARADIRSRARCLVTNPDMLHVSMLPGHKQFAKFFAGLTYVVLDEAHAYAGVFGSHVAMIVRRLRRVCGEEYGSSPRFIISSATVANPSEHARDLIGFSGANPESDAITCVTNDGAPRGMKTFLMWNPAFKPGQAGVTNTARKFMRRPSAVDRGKAALAKRLRESAAEDKSSAKDESNAAADGDAEGDFARTSPVVDVAQILAECVQHNLRCLAFCKTRKLCELVLVYAREILRGTAPHLADKISSYRGGYEAAERRGIEKELFSGVLLGVTATNALELGIDVGSLDVTLHLGFPGSTASLWQQAGRAGRREGKALSVYVAFDGPLDQYYMRHPRALFDAPLEMSYVDPANRAILEQHLACAAFERALFGNPGADEIYFGPSARAVAATMVSTHKLFPPPFAKTPVDIDAEIMSPLLSGARSTPAVDVSVRAIEEVRYDVVDASSSMKTIASIEHSKVFFEIYPGAVYMHQGKSMLCTHFDFERRRAVVRRADVKYFTRAKHQTTCVTPGGEKAYESFAVSRKSMREAVRCHECAIKTVFTGFSRVARGSQAKFDSETFAPPRMTEFATECAFLRVPDDVVARAVEAGFDVRASVHAASHCILNALPTRVPAGENDVGCECFAVDVHQHSASSRGYAPHRVLIYDKHQGGVGIAARARALFPELIALALSIASACSCGRVDGCPRCVQRLTCSAHNARCDKRGAEFILANLLDAFDDTKRA